MDKILEVAYPLWLMLLPWVGAHLWFLGGRVKKVIRRIVWAGVVGATLMVSGFAVVPSLLSALFLAITHHLPYGEKFDRYGAPIAWLIRSLVGFSFGLAFYPITHSFLPAVATLIAFIPLYAVSRNNNWYTWPVVEAGVGAAEGGIVLYYCMMVTIYSIVRMFIGG